MDNENMVCLHNGILLSGKEYWNHRMDGTENYHSEWGTLDPGRQAPPILSQMWLVSLTL